MHLIEMSKLIGTIKKWLPHDGLRLVKNKEPPISVIQLPPDLMGVTNKYCKNLNYILPTQKWNMLHLCSPLIIFCSPEVFLIASYVSVSFFIEFFNFLMKGGVVLT